MKNTTKGLIAFSAAALILMGLSAWGFVSHVERALRTSSLETYSETMHSIGQSIGTGFTRDLNDIEARVREVETEVGEAGRRLPAPGVYGIVTLYTGKGCSESAKADAGVCRELLRSDSDFGIVPPHISSISGMRVFNLWARGRMPGGERFWLAREYEVNAFAEQMIGAFGSLECGVYVVDAGGIIVMRSARGSNRTMASISDFIEEDRDQQSRFIGMHSSVRSVTTPAGGSAVMFTVPLFQKNGWSLVGIVPESVLRGDVSGFLYRAFLLILICCIGVGVFMGLWFHLKLTSQRKETELIQEKMRAFSASEAKSRFISNMTHDIRTPLNAITGMTAIARRSLDDRDRVADSLSKIEQACRLLLGIVNDVLDMSRIESGKMTLAAEPVNLPAVMEELRVMMEASPVTDDRRLSVCVGEIADPVVTADPSRLRQVLLNILTNAAKYTKPGGKIDFSLEQTGRTYRFRCTDDGIGIDEDLKERLFRPFERAVDSAVNRVSGVGLGLCITKNLVELMSGTISVKSEVGRGTDITIEIPFDPVDSQSETRPVQDVHFDETSLAGIHVLIVEDNDINAEVAAELLSFMGTTSERAADGREALEMLLAAEPGHFSMVFMDIQMPVMDGLESARRIRASGRADLETIPIAALTANAFTEESRIVKQAGMNDCLAKPVDMAALFLCISRWCGEALPEKQGKSEVSRD